MVLSMAIEAAAMITFHLSIPRDVSKLWPLVLTVPPALAPWICGYRKPKEYALLALLASVLTAGVSMLVNILTGISIGLLEP